MEALPHIQYPCIRKCGQMLNKLQGFENVSENGHSFK